jgi:hypothetical protein
MAWTATVAKPAQKQAAKFPVKDQQRIAATVPVTEEDPFYGDVLKLEGAGNRWRRPGWQLSDFFSVDITLKTVHVSAIFRRASTTYQ